MTPILTTSLPLPLHSQGKVRDTYRLSDRELLMIATDRISAFDVVLPTPIPEKGRVLNQLSAFWFQHTQHIAPNHLITTDVEQIETILETHGVRVDRRVLEGRAMLVNKARALPVECVVRGYLAGSAWEEYRQSGQVTGIALPPGLREGDRLPDPIFTP